MVNAVLARSDQHQPHEDSNLLTQAQAIFGVFQHAQIMGAELAHIFEEFTFTYNSDSVVGGIRCNNPGDFG